MRTIQQAVTRSTWPIAGSVTLIVMALLQPRAGVESEAPPIPDVPSVEVPVQTEWFQISAQDAAPPPPSKCVLDGRPGSGARKRSALEWFRGLSRRDREIAGSICSAEASQPCRGMMFPAARLTAEEQREHDRYIDESLRDSRRSVRRLISQLPEIERDCAADYCVAMSPQYCDTPLVVAFDSRPVVFETNQSTFAFKPDQPVTTDWPTAATPWIAIDLDHDGAITSGAELFGDATRLPDGSTAANGFAALAALDANHDGVIDRLDPAFHSLLLWADRNADRTSTPDELRALGDVVTAIPLANRITPRCDLRGNCEGERGVVRWQDESGTPHSGAVVDVYLPRR